MWLLLFYYCYFCSLHSNLDMEDNEIHRPEENQCILAINLGYIH